MAVLGVLWSSSDPEVQASRCEFEDWQILILTMCHFCYSPMGMFSIGSASRLAKMDAKSELARPVKTTTRFLFWFANHLKQVGGNSLACVLYLAEIRTKQGLRHINFIQKEIISDMILKNMATFFFCDEERGNTIQCVHQFI